MKEKNEIEELLAYSRKTLRDLMKTHKSTLSREAKQSLYNSIMHYDGRVYAYRQVLKLYE